MPTNATLLLFPSSKPSTYNSRMEIKLILNLITEKTMEFVIDVSIPNSPSSRQYVIDREELLQLKESKLISDKLFVYLAIKLTNDRLNPSIDVPSFCES